MPKDIDEELKQRIELEDRELKRKELKRNFVHKLADEIYIAKRIIDYDVALTCASTLINSCLPYVRLTTAIGPLPLNEMNIIIGASGTGKTLPFRIVKGILRELDIDFPGRYTVEGVERWFARREEVLNPRTNVPEETGPYVNPPYCSIVTDEISQSFKEAKKDYMAGSIELLSQMYDGELKGTALSGGARRPQAPIYVNLLGATVPEFLPDLPKYVFEQGMAGRIYWLFIEPKDTLPRFDIMDYKGYENSSQGLKAKAGTLQRLFDINVHLNPNRKEIPIRISSSGSKVWKKYHDKKYNEWRIDYKNKPYDYDWQYKRRLHELVLKKAGTFAIGRSIDLVRKTGSFKDVRVNADDMEMAVKWVEKSERNLRRIIWINKTGIVYKMGTRQALGEIYCCGNLQVQLLNAPSRMLSTLQLWEASRISDRTTFNKYLYEAIQKKLIRRVDKKTELKTEEERVRLGAEKGKKTYVWTVNDDFEK